MSEQAMCECGHAEWEHAKVRQNALSDRVAIYCIAADGMCDCREYRPTNTDTTTEAATCETQHGGLTPMTDVSAVVTVPEGVSGDVEVSIPRRYLNYIDDFIVSVNMDAVRADGYEYVLYVSGNAPTHVRFIATDGEPRWRQWAQYENIVFAGAQHAPEQPPTLSTTELEEIRERHEDANARAIPEGMLLDTHRDRGRLLTHIATLQHQLQQAGNRETEES